MWKEAGIPLEAALRGIDEAFDRYDARPTKTRKVNSLAYCAQEVLAAAEDMQEAAVGKKRERPHADDAAAGFSGNEVAIYLENRGKQIAAADKKLPEAARVTAENSAATLRELAHGLRTSDLRDVGKHAPLEELE